MTRRFAITTALALLAAVNAACGGGEAKTITSGRVGGLNVTLANDAGLLRHGEEEFTVTFRDSSGKAVDVGAASLNLYMPPMGTMAAMNNAVTLTTTPTPGVYRARVKIEMPGEWQAQIAYEGPAGSGKGSLPVTAQ